MYTRLLKVLFRKPFLYSIKICRFKIYGFWLKEFTYKLSQLTEIGHYGILYINYEPFLKFSTYCVIMYFDFLATIC